jgi:hypothetical protein
LKRRRILTNWKRSELLHQIWERSYLENLQKKA